MVIADFVLNASPRVTLKGLNVLILGLDDTAETQRSDTIMLVHINLKSQKLSLLSIPRDTKMKVPGLGETKVNHAYAFGKEKLAKQAISDLLGVPIHNSIVIKLSGVERFINVLGGLDITINKRMNYDDNAGKLHIHFDPGRQHVNGKEALEYLRFRHDEKADIGRIERQQSFVKEVMHKIVYSGQLLKLPFLVKALWDNVETDLSLREMVSMALMIKKGVENSDIQTVTLDGTPMDIKGVSYWEPNVATIEPVLDQWRFNNAGDTPKKQNAIVLPKAVEEETRPDDSLELKVEVLNGYGKDNVANKAAELFQEQGFKVTRIGNAGSLKYDQTVIVDWKGQGTPILMLARKLSIDPSRIIVYDKLDKPIDATIVLGKDWPQIEAKLKSKPVR